MRLGEINRRGINWEIRYNRAFDRYLAYVGTDDTPITRLDGVWKFYSVAAAQEAIDLHHKKQRGVK